LIDVSMLDSVCESKVPPPDADASCVPETCLVTGSLLPWTGGPLRSTGAFQQALDARIVSFLERRDVSHHALAVPQGRLALVTCRRFPGARHFLVPDFRPLEAARRIVESSDLVSCHSFYTFHSPWVHSVCRRRGLPYWIVPHGILDPYVARRNPTVKRLFMTMVGRACLANAAATVFSSCNERDKALQTARIANPVVIPWPVRIPPDFDRDAARSALRARLGIPPDANLLLFLGRLHPMKRPLDTIRMFAEGMDHRWHMLLVGYPDGVSAEDCRRVADSCGVGGRVHVVPGVDAAAVESIVQGCDLFISLSWRENFNNAAAECLASGIPILLSPGNDLLADIGPSPAVGVMSDDASATISSLKDWGSMDFAERFDRGRAGRNWAAANLSFEIFRKRLLALRSQTLSAHG
jgi:glycosyltransferase involved in cell wall biosynthesis